MQPTALGRGRHAPTPCNSSCALAAGALAVLAGLFLAVLMAVTLPAQADVLVSNMSKTNEIHVGLERDVSYDLLGGGYLVPWTQYQRGWPAVTYAGQSFRTGPHAAATGSSQWSWIS